MQRSRIRTERCLLTRYGPRTGLFTGMGSDLGLSVGGAQGEDAQVKLESSAVLGSELSLNGWTRSRRGEGLKRGWKWALPIGMVWAGPKAERAWPGLGVGPKGAGAGSGGGWGRDGGRVAGGPDVWGVPLRVCSPSLLASVWPRQRSAKVSELRATAPSAPAGTWSPAPGAAGLRCSAVLPSMERVKTASTSCKGLL